MAKSPKRPARAAKGKAGEREPLTIETHRDLRKNMRTICEMLNENPDQARLLLANPILALEDLGVRMSADVKEHILQSLRFPPSLVERKERLEAELRDELDALGVDYRLPLTESQRADLLFRVLGLEPRKEHGEAPERITSKQARAYRRRHELAAKLADYERARQGRMIFYPREAYEKYKAGLKRHNWIKAVTFKV